MTGLELAVRMVAAVLVGEAGGEPQTGMEAVAETIAVRMSERRQDAVTVVTDRAQYCAWRGARHARKVAATWEQASPAKWAYAREQALQVIEGRFPISEHRWNHFYRPQHGKKPPAWFSDFTESKRIGKQIFGRIEP